MAAMWLAQWMWGAGTEIYCVERGLAGAGARPFTPVRGFAGGYKAVTRPAQNVMPSALCSFLFLAV
eukprot:1241733-Rhodomonas_salina.1